MLYTAKKTSLWDTTLIHDGNGFHLFYLAGGKLGHAVSDDLATWEEREPITLKGSPGSWDEEGASELTGCIVKHLGRWHLFTGAGAKHRPSEYGLFLSDDLERWEPHPANPTLTAQGPYYRTEAQASHPMVAAWRDPAIYRREDGSYHCLMCARAPQNDADNTGAVIGHLRSKDLVRWEALPPLVNVGEHVLFAEVPGWFTLNGRHYLHFLDLGWGGTRVHAATQGQDLSGTYFIWSEAFGGPYQWPEEPLLIGSRGNLMGPWASRVLEYDGKVLLYHHISSSQSSFAVPKEIVELAPGKLGLRYLPILEKHSMGQRLPSDTRPNPQPRKGDEGRWRVMDDGRVLGSARAMGTSAMILDEVGDAIMEANLTVESGAAAGLVLRASGREPVDPFSGDIDQGIGVVFDVERQQVALREVSYQPGHGWGITWRQARGIDPMPGYEQVCPYALKHGQLYLLKVLMRERYIEVYVDDFWVLSLANPAFTKGRLELMVERGEGSFEAISVTELAVM